MSVWLSLVSAAVVAAAPPPPPPPELRSRAPAEVSVVDGSTLLIRTFRVVLAGVEGFERAQQCQAGGGYQACGRAAASRLTALVAGKDVVCAIATEGRRVTRTPESVLYGRCFAGGVDLSAALVDEGLAVGIAGTAYGPRSIQACLARRGVWSGSFEAPWTVRARQQGYPVAPVMLGVSGGAPCVRAVRPV
jgi:endonuclease YncB( thermonuclease family)